MVVVQTAALLGSVAIAFAAEPCTPGPTTCKPAPKGAACSRSRCPCASPQRARTSNQPCADPHSLVLLGTGSVFPPPGDFPRQGDALDYEVRQSVVFGVEDAGANDENDEFANISKDEVEPFPTRLQSSDSRNGP